MSVFIMKKVLLIFGAIFMLSNFCAFAQKGPGKVITTTKLAGTQETFEHTEAFSLESGHEMLVAPLVAKVEVISVNNDGKTFKRATFTGKARHDVPSGLAGNEYLVSKLLDGKNVTIDMNLLKAQATYDFCQETGADLIVVPQFNIRHRIRLVETVDSDGNNITIEVPEERDGKYIMIVNMVGFPARYTGFREGTKDDRWIKELYRMGQISNDDAHIYVEDEIKTTK